MRTKLRSVSVIGEILTRPIESVWNALRWCSRNRPSAVASELAAVGNVTGLTSTSVGRFWTESALRNVQESDAKHLMARPALVSAVGNEGDYALRRQSRRLPTPILKRLSSLFRTGNREAISKTVPRRDGEVVIIEAPVLEF